MVSLNSTIKIKPDVVSREVQGEEVILDLLTGTYYGLNEVGTRVWRLLKKNSKLSLVAKTLVKEYDVSQAQAEADVMSLVRTFKKNKLIDFQ